MTLQTTPSIRLPAALDLWLFVAAGARAESHRQEELEFVEPIVTEETLPNEVGEWDLRLELVYHKHGGDQTALIPQVSLFFGLFDGLGGEISMPLLYQDGEDGSSLSQGPLEASLKWRLQAAGESKPALVLGVEAGFPTGDEIGEAGERAWELTPFLAALTSAGRWTVQGNVGVAFFMPRSREPDGKEFVYNLAAAWRLADERWHLLLELNGAEGLEHADDATSVAPGLRFSPENETILGMAVPVGLNHGAPHWGVLLQWQTEL